MTIEPGATLLEARDVSFGYQRHPPVLKNWSASFVAGTVSALTGPSGRGKSTLLYLLGLMLKPSGGEVLVDGEPVGHLSDAQRAAIRADSYGFVFQDAALDPTRTIMDNVTESALYRGQPRERFQRRGEDLLRKFGVVLPGHRKPGQVSGGQAQRIALCRALLNQPRILLADEPTGNLDSFSSDLVVGALRDHARSGAAVIVVTHSPVVASACDRQLQL